MRRLVWSSTFRRAVKKVLKKQPQLRRDIGATLKLLELDPFDARLASHKLKGKLAGTWACSVAFDLRILFEFVKNPEGGDDDIFLIEIGTHEEVY